MPGRVGKRFKLAWESHYPGDVRSLHNDLLESYQLKAGDALVLLPFEETLRYWHGTHGRTAARQPLGRWVAESAESHLPSRRGRRPAPWVAAIITRQPRS